MTVKESTVNASQKSKAARKKFMQNKMVVATFDEANVMDVTGMVKDAGLRRMGRI